MPYLVRNLNWNCAFNPFHCDIDFIPSYFFAQFSNSFFIPFGTNSITSGHGRSVNKIIDIHMLYSFCRKSMEIQKSWKNAKLKMLYKNFVTRICDSIHLMVTQIAIYDLLVFNWLWIASVVRFMPFLFFSVLRFVFFLFDFSFVFIFS